MRERSDNVAVAIQAAEFLRAHSSEPISVGDVADHSGYSPFHLTRLFSQVIGTPPVRYLAAQRFHHAKSLLLRTDHTVADVCMAVGFSSVGTFTRRFTDDVGTSPRGFRRLPHDLGGRSERPIHQGGPGSAEVAGVVSMAADSIPLVGVEPHVYVGLFPTPSPRSRPVAGTMLTRPGPFLITGVPAGRWWLLAAAVPRNDPVRQLLVHGQVTAGHPGRVVIDDAVRRSPPLIFSLTLHPAAAWMTPVTVALPTLGRGRQAA